MKMNWKRIAAPVLALGMVMTLAACPDEADVASTNLSKAADNFEIMRRVVFVNGITNTYILSLEGRCSIEDQGNQLEVVCKIAEGDFYKHFLGLSDNTFYFVQQMDAVDVSVFHTRITFMPQNILPDIDFRGSADALINDDSG